MVCVARLDWLRRQALAGKTILAHLSYNAHNGKDKVSFRMPKQPAVEGVSSAAIVAVIDVLIKLEATSVVVD